jgi:hypothetical protein
VIVQNIGSAEKCLPRCYQAKDVLSLDRCMAMIPHVTVFCIILDSFLKICAGHKHISLCEIDPLRNK